MYLPACSQWKKRENVRVDLVQENQIIFLGRSWSSTIIVEDSLREYSFLSGQKTLGINLFCSVCWAQKYPPNHFQRDFSGLSWWLFAQCKIPRERWCINITFAHFPLANIVLIFIEGFKEPLDARARWP